MSVQPSAAHGRPGAPAVPDKPTLDGIEERWAAVWAEQGTYDFDPNTTREQVYSIDTPPLTASGAMHVGHAFSFTHTDLVARYQRMQGKNVFYPMGWDDNGLPTERRVQNFYGVRCDPSLPYDPDFAPPDKPGKDPIPISRPNFIALCHDLTLQDEKVYEAVWRRIGLSVDWSTTYRTIDDNCRGISQRGFLRNLARDEAYRAEAPTLWDVTYRTAVAQAELEDRERPGASHRIAFHRSDTHAEDGEPIYIETTRPELIPACVALVTHPGDKRYAAMVGTTVRTPIFGVEVPVMAHHLAEPGKGSGIAMICTFGDLNDVTWWRELSLPTRSIVGWDGRVIPDPPPGLESAAGLAAYEQLAGATMFSARERVVAMLRDSGDLDGAPKPITHPVKFYENGDRPLEIVTTRQWYIRNGGRDETLRAELIARGKEIDFHPPFMRHRYENWVSGLNGDWLISRQRFFGVAFPLWYELGPDGEPAYERMILADEADLPIDPSSDAPRGYTEDQRGKPNGFIGDPDIMDTWATSSLSPQIACGWGRDEELFANTFPMDLRPQAHDIIRTWLFATVVRAHFEHDGVPWRNAAISGFILDPDRKKMSKSKGNVTTPMDLLLEHGSDAVRYWATSGRLGIDTALEPGQMKVGRRLAIKLLNASKFALAHAVRSHGAEAVTDPLDRAMLAGLADVVAQATSAMDSYEHQRALEVTEGFFWTFCDDYLELVKARAYGDVATDDPAATSAHAALGLALSVLQRLFAPILPFATEEVWSWWQEGSVHRASWPTVEPLRTAAGDAVPATLAVVGQVLSEVRKAKSGAKLSMRAEVDSVTVTGSPGQLALVEAGRGDLRNAGRIRDLELIRGDGPISVEVVLAEPAPTAD